MAPPPVPTRYAIATGRTALLASGVGPWGLLQPVRGPPGEEQGAAGGAGGSVSVFQSSLLSDGCVPTLCTLMAQWRRVQA